MAKWDEYTSLVRAPIATDPSSYQASTGTGMPGRGSEALQTIMGGQDPIFSCCEKIMWLVVKLLSIAVVFGAMLCEFLLIAAIVRTKIWTSECHIRSYEPDFLKFIKCERFM